MTQNYCYKFVLVDRDKAQRYLINNNQWLQNVRLTLNTNNDKEKNANFIIFKCQQVK